MYVFHPDSRLGVEVILDCLLVDRKTTAPIVTVVKSIINIMCAKPEFSFFTNLIIAQRVIPEILM